MRKLIILLLFLVFTVAAIGFISFSSFTMATNIKIINSESSPEDAALIAGAMADTNKESFTLIENPLAGISALSKFGKIAVIQVGGEAPAGYLAILSSDISVDPDVVTNHIHGSSVFMWLFTLILIILLPKKMSKRKVRRIAEDTVEDEVGSRRPPRRSYRGRRDDDYDDYED